MKSNNGTQKKAGVPVAPPLRHFLRFDDFTREEITYVCSRSQIIKNRFKRYEFYQPLRDRTLAMIFEKASTRTRVSFEAGMYQMGGSVIHLTTGDSQLSRAEPIEDTARVISRMVDIVMIRTYAQAAIERFAEYSRVPVINGLTDEYHPCQVLADIFTYMEHRGSISGRTVAWVGDANNMAYTWIQAAGLLDFTVNVSTPPGYPILGERAPAGPHFRLCDAPAEAAQGADLVTTDVWASMGSENEARERRQAFSGWCVNAEVMAAAQPDALFMHCLPAHRGEEVSAEVLEGSQSVVWDEAENRLHAQKALMEFLLFGRDVE
jgi:ornithine carbamoyltransferase